MKNPDLLYEISNIEIGGKSYELRHKQHPDRLI